MFKCPKCNKSSTNAKWNASTRVAYGEDIYTVKDEEMADCSYICPECKTDVTGRDMEEVTNR